jgi:hypothetical protein
VQHLLLGAEKDAGENGENQLPTRRKQPKTNNPEPKNLCLIYYQHDG